MPVGRCTRLGLNRGHSIGPPSQKATGPLSTSRRNSVASKVLQGYSWDSTSGGPVDKTAKHAMLELAITLPPRGSGAVMRVLHKELRAAILDGRLKPGLRLPSTRILADSWGVSRNTGMGAYDLLLSEGYLFARHGAGTYVAEALPIRADRTPVVEEPNQTPDRRLSEFWQSPPPYLMKPWASTSPSHLLFRLGGPDTASFPYHIWRRLLPPF